MSFRPKTKKSPSFKSSPYAAPSPAPPQAPSAYSAPAPAPSPAPMSTPVVATAVPPPAPAPAPPAPAPKEEPAPADEGAHFDVAQHAYGAVKGLWSWGKSVPVVSNFLGVSEAIAAKLLDVTVHMDLPALDTQVATPQLKKLDDDVVTPVILAVWKIIEPALAKSDEMVLQPVMKEVVPRVLAPLGMFDKQEKDAEAKKAEERKAMIDISPNPELVPALN